MKFIMCLLMLVSMPVFGAFKITVLSSDKPAINKIDVPADKPSIKIEKRIQSAKQPNVVLAQSPKNNANTVNLSEPETANKVEDINTDKDINPVKTEPVFIADAPKDSDLNLSEGMSRYEELQKIKKAQGTGQHVQPDNKGVSVGIIDADEPIKPLLGMSKGQTFKAVLSEWAKSERYQVVFDLGVWERVKELKMSVNYLFTTDLKESVENYLDLLNSTPSIKQNDVSLHACFYSNRFFKVTTNSSDCEV